MSGAAHIRIAVEGFVLPKRAHFTFVPAAANDCFFCFFPLSSLTGSGTLRPFSASQHPVVMD